MKKVFIYFFAMVLVQLCCIYIVKGVWMIVTQSTDVTTTELIVSSSLPSIVTIALFVFMKWTPFSRTFMQSRPWALLFWCVVIGIGMLVPSQFIEELIPQELTKDVLSNQFKMLFSNSWGYLVIGLLAPLVEEMVFRGAIQKAAIGFFEKEFSKSHSLNPEAKTLNSNMPHWIGIAFTAILFALMHGNPAQMPHAFLIGLLLGWMCYRSGSIVPGIVVHWVNNTLAYVMYAMYPQTYDMKIADLFGHSPMRITWAIIFSLMIFCAGVYQYHIRSDYYRKD